MRPNPRLDHLRSLVPNLCRQSSPFRRRLRATQSATATKALRLVGAIPPEVWNRLGTKILPKLRSGSDLKIDVDFSVTVTVENADQLAAELRQILQELGLADTLRLE